MNRLTDTIHLKRLLDELEANPYLPMVEEDENYQEVRAKVLAALDTKTYDYTDVRRDIDYLGTFFDQIENANN